MSWAAVGRFALWALVILLASIGGGLLHSALTSYGSGPETTSLALMCLLTAAAIYRQRLR